MKRIKKSILFLFLIMIFIPFTKVDAATCADVKTAVSRLKTVNSTISKLKCDSASTESVVSKCNTLKVEKNTLIENIFYYSTNKICPSQNLTSIVNEYKGNCTNEFSSKLKDLVETVLQLFYITAPFLLIIFGSLDFFKIMAGSNPEQIKKHRSNFIKRVIAFVLLYLTPLFVKTIFSITPYGYNTTQYTCAQEITLTPKLTSETVTGYYYENSYSGGSAGKRIAEEARKIKKHTIAKKYIWGCNYHGLNQASSATDKRGIMCCAELIAPSVYRAKIYDEATSKKLHSASAAGVYNTFKEKGWTLITDPKKLQPGDIVFYHNFKCSHKGCGFGTINGKHTYIGHVEIYYGDGKTVSAGGDDNDGNFVTELNKFVIENKNREFVGALRYPGK